MKSHTTLYKYDNKSRLRIWTLYINENKVYSIYGLENGKKTKSTPQIFYDSKLKNASELAITFYNKTIKAKTVKGFSKSRVKTNNLTILPMRAHKYEDHYHKINYPAYVQIKYDGFRCNAHYDKKLKKVVLTSNNGKVFYNLELIESQLKPFLQKTPNLYFDGELYIHNTKLQNISSLLLSKKPVDTSKIVYNIFDCFFLNNMDLPFKKRYLYLKKIFNKSVSKNNRLHLVECFNVENKDEVDSYFNEFLKKGYEGIIIRNYDGIYKLNGKSYDVQRSKEFKSDMFKIVGAKRGSGQQKDSVIWILQCTENKNKNFYGIPYGSIKERENWWINRKKYINTIVEVKYILKDKDGCIVRNPIVVMK